MNIIEKDINFYTEKMEESKDKLTKHFPSINHEKELHEIYEAIVLKLNNLKHVLNKNRIKK